MPSTVIEASESVLEAENVNASKSTSLAESSNVKDSSSFINWSTIELITGASLTAFTVNAKLPLSLAWPSLTVILTKIFP